MIDTRNKLWLIALAAAMLWGSGVRADLFVVTDPGDSGPGTLRDAIARANTRVGPDSIEFNLPLVSGVPAPIGLTSRELLITDTVQINNASAQNVTVQRDAAAAEFGIFDIDTANPIVVKMHGLNVFNGASTIGGGLLMNSPAAQVLLTSMYFKDNRATGGNGGAINNIGRLTVVNSTFQNNSATGEGGAINNSVDGRLDVFQSTFARNKAVTSSNGGAINHTSSSVMNVLNSAFCKNVASSDGGGIRNFGTIPTLLSNELGDNMAPSGPDLRDAGTITTGEKNVVETADGHMLDPTKNQIGVDPNFGTLGMNGGPVPTKGKKIGITPGAGAGANTLGLEGDQRGGFRWRPTGTETDAGPTQSGNGFFIGPSPGKLLDSNNWPGGILPGAGDCWWINGDPDATGETVIAECFNVGYSLGVNARGLLTGTNATFMVTDGVSIGHANADLFAPLVNAIGCVDVTNSSFWAGGELVVGASRVVRYDGGTGAGELGSGAQIEDGGLGRSARADGKLIMRQVLGTGARDVDGDTTLGTGSGGNHVSKLHVDGNIVIASALADGPSYEAVARAEVDVDVGSIGFDGGAGSGAEALSETASGSGGGEPINNSYFIAQAFAFGGSDATAMADVTIAAPAVVADTFLGFFSVASGSTATSSGMLNIDTDTLTVNGFFDLASAQGDGPPDDPLLSSVGPVDAAIKATVANFNQGFTAGHTSLSIFSLPAGSAAGVSDAGDSDVATGTGGTGGPTAHVGVVNVDLDVQTLNMRSVLGVGQVAAVGPGTSTIDEVSVTITGSTTTIALGAQVGQLFLSGGATGMVQNALLDVQGGSFTVTDSVMGFPDLAIGTVNAFTPAGVAQTNATARFANALVELVGGVDIAVADVEGADPASFANGTLELINSEAIVGGDVRAAINQGAVPINTSAAIALNPSLLSIVGDLLLGEGATLAFGIEGLTRPQFGIPGQYGAINATNATLDGDLVLDFDFPGAQEGNMFELIRLDAAGAFSGFFDETTIIGLPAGLTAEATIIGASLFATVIAAAGIAGDYNGDGTVNAADYVVWRKNLGSDTSLPNDDTPGVGPDDYDRWRINFGRTAAAGSGATAPSSVPEPASIPLLLFAFFAFGTSVIRRR